MSSDVILESLLNKIRLSIKNTVSEKKISVAFSGGVDSSLISKICYDLGYDIKLLTIGFPNSHDILFAKKVCSEMNLSHHVLEIDEKTFPDISSKIHDIIKTDNLSWNENCIAFYYVSKLAKSLQLDTVVTANGIDELFCGYNAYREVFTDGDSQIIKVMNTKIENEIKMMKAVNKISSQFNVKILQPLLSQEFIEFAKTIPMSQKILGPEDLMRKHVIRNLAKKVGVPELAYSKRKKALQYGSNIHKLLLKIRKTS